MKISEKMNKVLDELTTVRIANDKSYVDILDQTLLPGTVMRKQLFSADDVADAIKKLEVRGAPAIGIAAAYGLALTASKIEVDEFGVFKAGFAESKSRIAAARPTAVNLFYGLDRIEETMLDESGKLGLSDNSSWDDVARKRLLDALFEEADRIRDEDVAISRNIGMKGLELLEGVRTEKGGERIGILTHCNAGTLATARYGTATAPIYMAIESGWDPEEIHVHCNETRPLLQGARLTSFELGCCGIPVSVQCDDMAAVLMEKGKIDIIFVGTDRVAANGDFANKIGTKNLAIVAKHFGVPMYVCAPSSTIDKNTKTGADIPIEMRGDEEVREMWYTQPMIGEGIEIFNPAFDVTERDLVSGIITEDGFFD